jgi:hypothetical protein
MPEHDSPSMPPEPSVSSLDFEDDRGADRVRPASPSATRPNLWWLAAIALIVVGGPLLYWWREQAPRVPTPPPIAETPPAPPAKAEPAIRHPIEDSRAHAGLPESAGDRPLPPLAESDATLREALAALPGGATFERFFHPQDIVRRFVATVDNLPRKSVAAQVRVVKPVDGAFSVTGSEGTMVIGASNASRYAPHVQLVEAVDTKTLVALYVRFYPWFQQAYLDLGYPSGYFNDRLIEVIDMLLATPDISGPVALVQPRVLYQFADPRLEALPAGQKMMLRMGGENASRVKVKLREVRRALTGALPPP